MNQYIQNIKEKIEPLRQQIINHPVYEAIKTIDDLRIFMQYHVYAVWDFMSLLKALQNNLTCTTIPWLPKGTGNTRFLINEIVVGEECDVDLYGNRKSHFELYLDAMAQSAADTLSIQRFITTLSNSSNLLEAFEAAQTPPEAVSFVNNTFQGIEANKTHVLSAIFTFGREDLIPDMFLSIISKLHQNFPNQLAIFKYYIERHIEVDGGHHSNLAKEMTTELCNADEQLWKEAELAVMVSLQSRINLWNGVYNQLKQSPSNK